MNSIPPIQSQPDSCDKGHIVFKEACKACGALQKTWYSFLARSGFEDQERGVYLVQDNLNNLVDMQHSTTFNAKRDYYQWAQECLTCSSFDSMIDRLIWQYHSEGYSQREISPIVELSQPWINRKIQRLEKWLKAK